MIVSIIECKSENDLARIFDIRTRIVSGVIDTCRSVFLHLERMDNFPKIGSKNDDGNLVVDHISISAESPHWFTAVVKYEPVKHTDQLPTWML